MPTILQFMSLPDLALYSKKLANKGYQINVQTLTLKGKLTEAEIILAQEEHHAIPAQSNKTNCLQDFSRALQMN